MICSHAKSASELARERLQVQFGLARDDLLHLGRRSPQLLGLCPFRRVTRVKGQDRSAAMDCGAKVLDDGSHLHSSIRPWDDGGCHSITG